VAAIRLAQLGEEVILVEREELGGTCLNRGCIPTKTLLEAAEHVRWMRENAAKIGVDIRECRIDMNALLREKDAVVGQLRQGIRLLLKSRRVKVIKGEAVFLGAETVAVEGEGGREIFTPRAVVIATGSVARELPVPGGTSRLVLQSEEVLDLDPLPGDLAIIGGGVIGVELATIYSGLGSRVTILEMMDRVLPALDAELSAACAKALRGRGVKLHLQSTAEGIADLPDGKARVRFVEGGAEAELLADRVAVCVGRKANIGGLGLEKAGVRIENGWIGIDAFLRTSVPGIYAVGDVTGGPLLAHVASHQGAVAACNIHGEEKEYQMRIVPQCVFASPEIATVGLSEAEARNQGRNVVVGRFPMGGNGKAVLMRQTGGFAKIVVDAGDGDILGVQIIGPHASDLIGEAVMAMQAEATVHEMAEAIHPHPTLTESLHEAALAALGMPIHAVK
jgi:dihydrolipoamide dehydrogenase